MIVDKIKISARGAYEPAEDSELLAAAVEKYAFGRALDMGTGSGILGIVAAKKRCDVTFADIDPKAIEVAKSNAQTNNVGGEFIVSDLFENTEGKFNTVIFNPPYLPSKETKVKALDGGKDGRETINRFLKEYKNHVENNHVVLLLESSFNDYQSDIKDLNAEIVGKAHYFFEDLVVLKFE